MRIDPKSEICGIPALRVRDALRYVGFYTAFDPDALASRLEVSKATAELLAKELSHRKYIEPSTEFKSEARWYRLTLAGGQFAIASGAKPISRNVAALKIAELLERVKAVNADGEYVSEITKVCVFGSFLRQIPLLSDVDVGYETKRRYTGEAYRHQAERRRQLAYKKGRRLRTIHESVSWPDTEILLLLKARSRAISLHYTSELEQEGFPYKEVFPRNELAGDPDLDAALRSVQAKS